MLCLCRFSYELPESRVKRHLSDNKKKHWHIDYLTKQKLKNREKYIQKSLVKN
ncbi:MAG: DUF123 domain-containing protein [Ruminococcus sp.]